MSRRRANPTAVSLTIAGYALALVACAPSPSPAPPTPSPAQFQSAASLPPGAQPWPSDAWWRDFGDPQLDQLVTEAVANSPSMAEAAARVRLARAQVIGARSALLPDIGALGTVRATRVTENIGLPSTGDWGWLGAALVTGSFEIDFWGKNHAALKAATSEARAVAADAAAARLMLAFEVATAYVDFARLEVDRGLAASELTIRSQTRDLVARRLAAGTAPKQALEQADATVLSATERLRALDESLALARHAIAALVGAGPDRGDRLTTAALLHRRSPGLPSDLPLALVGRKPELVAARWRAEAAAQRIHEARAAYYPNVNLMGLAGVASMGLDRLFEQRSGLVSVGPAITVPIFEGGRLEAGYRGARAEYDLAVASYREVLLQSLKQAADAVASLRALQGRARAADAAAAQAQSAYDLTRLRYQGGLADYDAVLISENALFAARAEAADLQLRGFQLDVALADALGGGFTGELPPGGHPHDA